MIDRRTEFGKYEKFESIFKTIQNFIFIKSGKVFKALNLIMITIIIIGLNGLRFDILGEIYIYNLKDS